VIARWVETAQRRRQYPREPWLWRRDWAERTLSDESYAGTGCLWTFAAVWIAFTLPLALLFRTLRDRDPKFGFAVVLPFLGLLLVAIALYQTVRRLRYGTTICRIERVPIPMGGTLRGEIDLRLREVPASGFEMRLACVRRTESGSSRNRSTHETILWQNEQTVMHGATPGPRGLRVPFRFDIPREGESANLQDPNDTINWRLDVSAKVPGIDLAARFDLPVFRVAEGGSELIHTPFTNPSSWTPPPEIEVTGPRVTIRPSRGVGDWITTVGFMVIWFGALAFFRRLGVPLAVVLFFAAIGSLVFVLVLDFLLGRSTLILDGRSLRVHRTWLGLGAQRRFSAEEIDRIEPVLGSTFGNRAFHDVAVRLHSGRTRKIARHLRNRRDAEMLAAWAGRGVGK
jgi:hypothetical protein